MEETVQLILPQQAKFLYDALLDVLDGLTHIPKDPKTAIMSIGNGVVTYVNICSCESTGGEFVRFFSLYILIDSDVWMWLDFTVSSYSVLYLKDWKCSGKIEGCN